MLPRPGGQTETPPARTAPTRTEIDNLTDDIMKQTMQMMRAATAEALSGAKAPPVRTPAPASSEEPLRAATGGATPIPVPVTADEVEFNGARGTIEFRSASSVTALASFYRMEMAPLGWKEQRSVIDRANMVV